MLSKEQYIGAAILLVLAIGTWLFVALRPQTNIEVRENEWSRRDSLRAMQDSLRRDSLRQVREARWQHKKDSFRRLDDQRFAAWTKERQLRYDSFRLTDSLWRDSVGWHYARHAKKDTILDLNRTDTAELQFIRGIGAYKARRIMQYGQQLGGYYSPQQLCDSALADLHLDTLLACFTAQPEDVQRMDINHCSADKMARHPYMRYQQAKAIYEYRRQHVQLTQPEDLLAIPGLTSTWIERITPYLSFE